MKTAHDLVAAAKARVQEIAMADAEQAIRDADVLSAAALHEMGYLNVQSIAGGFDAWAAAGKPVAKPEVPSFD